jgi:hypothetical protein
MPTDLPSRLPTDLPSRRKTEPSDNGFRNVMIAGACLLAVLGLVCEKYLPATPGYSLAQSSDQIQLSP